MKKQLPITFRINGSGRFAESLIEKLSGDFMGKFSADREGMVVDLEVENDVRGDVVLDSGSSLRGLTTTVMVVVVVVN